MAVTEIENAPSAEPVAGDSRGQNYFEIDQGLKDILNIYLPDDAVSHFTPHFNSLGEMAGGHLDQLAETADKHPPVLHPRDRFGHDKEWIEYHPAYTEMEKIAFIDLGLAAMSHRGGVTNWPTPVPPLAKYAFQYLFVQAEFGLMCPISLCDTANFILLKYSDEKLRKKIEPHILSQDPKMFWKGSQFITEKMAGSDIGALETTAERDSGLDHMAWGEGGTWRLYGEKWFCSNTDADFSIVLARPVGAGPGTKSLGLFLLPKTLDDGSRNNYRITRLKDKLGTKSMASGEIMMDGAIAFPIGPLDNGFKQMMDQINLSRLSHGVRAAAMMRRCLNEAIAATTTRVAFGKSLASRLSVKRQLIKIMVPTEQALSVFAYTAATMEKAYAGDAQAQSLLRLLTPLIKYRACRDNIGVATWSMELRGGNGYIEDWVNARLVRDAQVGLLWEGTSNIISLDAIYRAVGKHQCHEALSASISEMMDSATNIPEQIKGSIRSSAERAAALADEVAKSPDNEGLARKATAALYNALSAALMIHEADRSGNGKRYLLAMEILRHRLTPYDPMAFEDVNAASSTADLLLSDEVVSLETALNLT